MKKITKHFKYFYSWVASIIAANISLLLGNLIIFNRLEPKERLPDYANASVNIMVRLPLWIIFTVVITIAMIFIFQKTLKLKEKLKLIFLNGWTWILSLVIFIVLYIFIPLSWDNIITLPSFLIILIFEHP